jgi:hypothetical protein
MAVCCGSFTATLLHLQDNMQFCGLAKGIFNQTDWPAYNTGRGVLSWH